MSQKNLLDLRADEANLLTAHNADYIATQLAKYKWDKGAIIVLSACRIGVGGDDEWLQIIANTVGVTVYAPTDKNHGDFVFDTLESADGKKLTLALKQATFMRAST